MQFALKKEMYLCQILLSNSFTNLKELQRKTKQAKEMTDIKTAVVIPVYRNRLSELERRSLAQAYSVLNAYPLIIVKPESLDLTEIKNEFPLFSFVSFDDSCFQSIAQYNRLMLSARFYGQFREYDYILIYQTDAFVFRDELDMWAKKGYDYTGAPWLKRKVYDYPVVSQLFALGKLFRRQGEPSKQDLYNKTGNGGFSLRKVESHYHACVKYAERIAEYLSHPGNHLYNEDVFWATEVPGFKYPDAMEALHFSFDKYPRYSFRLTKGDLPFGCHGWYKRKMKRFWQPIIGF